MKSPTPGQDAEASWQEIGFHRPLAGILFNLVFVFIAAGFGIVFAVWFIPNIVFPFASGLGYQDLVLNLFGLLFTILDVGIGASISRFVAEENIKNPRKGIFYLQFFIWFQMISGLFQVTAISIWAIFFAPGSNLGYAVWFLVIYSTIQYPGCLWIFNGGLQAYQRFDKARLVGFIQVQLFENLLRILFIFTGRYLGTLYPQVGELMGAVVGSLIGLISRDFLSAWLSAHWLSQVLRERVDPAFKIRDLFKIEFGKDVAIRCISYGLRAMVPGLISPMANFISVLLIVTYLPNYSSIVGMYQLGSMLSQMITTFTIDITPTVSEAYNNGKKVLTEYYIARSYTWTMINGTFILGLLFGGAELLGVIAGENFFLAVPIIQTLIFFRIGEMYAGLHDGIFHGVGKPELNILLIAAEQTVRVLILLVMLVGAEGGWLALVLSQGFGWIAKWVAGYVVFNLKVMHLTRINPWQSFVAPAIATLAEVVYILVMKAALYPLLIGILGNVAAAIVAVVIGVLTGPFFIYFPVYSAVGGWDEESLQIVACATRMAGPSKPLVNIIYKLSLYVTRVSPLHARFPTDIAGVQDEIDSLMRIRDRR